MTQKGDWWGSGKTATLFVPRTDLDVILANCEEAEEDPGIWIVLNNDEEDEVDQVGEQESARKGLPPEIV